MSEVVLKFANEDQYKRFIEKVKEDVLKEIKPPSAYHPQWASIREQMENKLRNGYSDNCGWWHVNSQGLYAAFRLAFQQPTIKDLRNVDGDKIQSFHDELFALIDKYRNNQD